MPLVHYYIEYNYILFEEKKNFENHYDERNFVVSMLVRRSPLPQAWARFKNIGERKEDKKV